MMCRYWIISESSVVFDDPQQEVSGVVSDADTTGRWQQYLAWVAEGNTAEEWQPESEGM